ncbi:unnamed protein product [Bemisia tabaci]|uniref:Retrotransposon gag domain-containing protein n=1 Tax=Bemisia tabaci TaxID=7038 RepID=A0A9P0A8H7_BEMTA|nr:unnamed protein product [Bemisia tabaci]
MPQEQLAMNQTIQDMHAMITELSNKIQNLEAEKFQNRQQCPYEKTMINFLSTIPEFDGNCPQTLPNFIRTCDEAVTLFWNNEYQLQNRIMMNKFISKLKGSAAEMIAYREFITWDSLKKFLLEFYGDRENAATLMFRSANVKQTPQESATTFLNKIISTANKALNHLQTYDSEMTAKELLENYFLHLSLENIKEPLASHLKARDPKTLGEVQNLLCNVFPQYDAKFHTNETPTTSKESPRFPNPTRFQKPFIKSNFQNQPSPQSQNQNFPTPSRKPNLPNNDPIPMSGVSRPFFRNNQFNLSDQPVEDPFEINEIPPENDFVEEIILYKEKSMMNLKIFRVLISVKLI